MQTDCFRWATWAILWCHEQAQCFASLFGFSGSVLVDKKTSMDPMITSSCNPVWRKHISSPLVPSWSNLSKRFISCVFGVSEIWEQVGWLAAAQGLSWDLPWERTLNANLRLWLRLEDPVGDGSLTGLARCVNISRAHGSASSGAVLLTGGDFCSLGPFTCDSHNCTGALDVYWIGWMILVMLLHCPENPPPITQNTRPQMIAN